ncbi:MAG: TatD family hydrolase [Candidatus Korarchaeum sp.]|nr:TatD family hydrolase [Candidatus Korarchaeum sp.]
MLFDAHCHLEDGSFDPDRDEVLARAKEAGVIRIVTSPLSSDDTLKALSYFRRSDLVSISIGLDVSEYCDEEVERTFELIITNSDEIVAVGEVGLDYRVASTGGPSKERQKEVFRRFIRLAEELDKPLVVHSLWAQRPTLNLLDEEGATRVILHAFGGKLSDVEFAVARGWFISIPTNVIRSSNVRSVAEITPLDNMVLESDSPVLAPDPNERNEPANLIHSANFLAKLKGVSPEDIAEITTSNAKRVYCV